MNTLPDLQRTYQTLETHVPDTVVRVLRRAEVGTVAQQGDVYLHRVADDHPKGAARKPADPLKRQLALGSTVGARHVAEGAEVEVYEGKALPPWVKCDAVMAAAILGPVVVSVTGFRVTHPEHPHHDLPAGTWQVTYPYDHREKRRVAD